MRGDTAPKLAKEAEEAEDWLNAGVVIPGWGSDASDSRFEGRAVEFSEGEVAELLDFGRQAYKEARPPPANAAEWKVPKARGIALVGRYWKSRQWRAQYRK